MNDLLEAPCIFCGYDGPDYWQGGTHRQECPWHGVGGEAERREALRGVVGAMRTCCRTAEKFISAIMVSPGTKYEEEMGAKYFTALGGMLEAFSGSERE